MAYDGLVSRFESYFIEEVLGLSPAFPAYKVAIQKRFGKVKPHLLRPQQKTFFTRLQSALDDRTAWLASIAQSCLGKALTAFTDEDEVLLCERVKDLVYELDNISEISRADVNNEEEEVLKLEITSFVQGLNKNLLRIPAQKNKAVEAQVSKFRANLDRKDRQLNIAALTKLLQELLQHA